MTNKKGYNNKQAKAICIALLLTASAILIVIPQQALASHYLQFPNHPNSLLERDFGFVTTVTSEGVHGSPPPTFNHDIDQIRKLDPSLVSLNLQVKSNSSPLGATAFVNSLNAALNAWDAYDTYTAQPSYTVVEDNLDTNIPSLFSDCGGTGLADGEFEAAFCSRGLDDPIAEVEYSPGFAAMATDGGTDTYDESDVAFNLDIDLNGDGIKDSWTQTTLDNVARHEIGHFFGHGDLYGLFLTQDLCDNSEKKFGNGVVGPVMCDDENQVSVGDADGLFYLYPNLESLSITETFSGSAGDIAITDLAGDADNTEPEFVVVEIDEDTAPTPDRQHFIVKPFLDVDENTYTENTGVQEELFFRDVSSITDVGLSFANVDRQGDNPDLVVSWVETSSAAYWRVYWDVSLTASEDLQWVGSPSSIFTMSGFPSNPGGIDTVFMNMDGDAQDEMVVISSHYNGVDDVADYHFVELSSTTGGASGSWTHFTNTGIVIEDDAVGAAIIDSAKRLVAIVYNAEDLSTPEFGAYNVMRLNTDGTIAEYTNKQLTTQRQTDSHSTVPDGFGADAYPWQGAGVDGTNTAGQEYRDLVILTSDEGLTEFTVERDTRYNAHGTADDAGRQ
jgi:hypothetical protein